MLTLRRSFCIHLSFLAAALFGCGSNSMTTATPPPTSVTPVVKMPINGLVAMNELQPTYNTLADPNANPNIFAATVIHVNWADLQPNGPGSFVPNVIDTALANIQTYNVAHPGHPMTGKLRVFAGGNSPNWVLTQDGGPVLNVAPNGHPVPKYWTADYAASWQALQVLLAARYDTNPLLQEVAVSGCSSSTGEPFVHERTTSAISAVQQAGYTDQQFMTCLSTMATQYAAWTITPLDYTFNEFEGLDSGQVVYTSAFSINLMSQWRATLGTARGVIANHDLNQTVPAGEALIYPEFTVLGPPVEFQTIAPTTNFDQSIALAVTYKCTEFELWTTTQGGGTATITTAQLQAYAAKI